MNYIENFTKRFLNYKTVIIFLFTALIVVKNYSTNSALSYLTIMAHLIGVIGMLSWLYAIASKSNQVLINKGVELKIFRNFKINCLMLVLSCMLLFIWSFIASSKISTENDLYSGEGYTYIKIILVLLLITLITALFVLRGVAKLLVSAECGEEKSFKAYNKTFFLLIFSWIGVWFIHPRAQQLE